MARERMVTRTITETIATTMRVDMLTQKVVTEEIIIPKMDEKDMLKYINKNIDNDLKKTVTIMSVQTKENLYGMSELQFMQYAELLPPRSEK